MSCIDQRKVVRMQTKPNQPYNYQLNCVEEVGKRCCTESETDANRSDLRVDE